MKFEVLTAVTMKPTVVGVVFSCRVVVIYCCWINMLYYFHLQDIRIQLSVGRLSRRDRHICRLIFFSIPKMEAAGYFEILLNLYHATWHHDHGTGNFKVSQGTHSLTVVACLNLLKSVRYG
jgi:hypothetical protein